MLAQTSVWAIGQLSYHQSINRLGACVLSVRANARIAAVIVVNIGFKVELTVPTTKPPPQPIPSISYSKPFPQNEVALMKVPSLR